MRLDDERESSNIEDRRGQGFSFGGGGLPGIGVGRLGIGGVVLLVLVSWALGIDPTVLLSGGGPARYDQPAQEQSRGAGQDDPGRRFVARVLASTEDVWSGLFAGQGRPYRPPRLVLFSGATQSGCGFAQSAVGPFYCPADQRVYIDLDFFQELETRFQAPGDFARAYVIAHEVGHHVQTLLGISERVTQQRQRASQREGNALSVRLELQADCFAGVWAYHADQERRILEPGDLEEGLQAASAVGDDRLQRQAQGHVVPDSFTHGSSAQRVDWFRRGFDSGDVGRCDTFSSGP
jgi:predicted metalloprotease